MKPATWAWAFVLVFTYAGAINLSSDLEDLGQDHAGVSIIELALGAALSLGMGYRHLVGQKFWPVVTLGIALSLITPLLFPSGWSRFAAMALCIAVALVTVQQSFASREAAVKETAS